MKLNWAERLAVNNPVRPIQQLFEIHWMKRHGALKEGAVTLEVGCGRGVGGTLISKEFKPAVLHLSDLDVEMARKAKGRLCSARVRRHSVAVADAFLLPYRDASVDAVFGFGVLHHVPDWPGAVSEIARVLKQGGLYFLEELYPALYQNFLTRHILLHPKEGRFRGPDLKRKLEVSELDLRGSLEHPWLGILGVAVRRDTRR